MPKLYFGVNDGTCIATTTFAIESFPTNIAIPSRNFSNGESLEQLLSNASGSSIP
jgi:hypothetical protein